MSSPGRNAGPSRLPWVNHNSRMQANTNLTRNVVYRRYMSVSTHRRAMRCPVFLTLHQSVLKILINKSIFVNETT